MNRYARFALFTCLGFSSITGVATAEKTVHWPSFRGPTACGVAKGFNTPTTWDVESGDNILWNVKTPGLGLSSPVIWGDRLFITTAVRTQGAQPLKVGLYGEIEPVKDDSSHEWLVLCLDKKTGNTLWQQKAAEGVPKVKRHTKASHANCTPATDGKHIVAFFGSEGLYCYDIDGKLLWKRDFGVLDSGYFEIPEAQWGFASSPIIHGDMVIVQCDVQRGSFVAALSLKDGSDLWMTQRRDVPTWSTPTVVNGTVVVNGWKHIGGYDLKTGEEVWKLRGGGDIPVPTPIVAHDLIYITNAHGMEAPVYAVRVGARGKLSKKNVGGDLAWKLDRRGNYMQTPLVYGDYLYCCRDNGVIACYEAKTGREIYQKRLGSGMSGFTASGIATDDKLYFTSEEGDVYVLAAGPEFKQLAKNSLGDVSMATPAISEGVLYFRTQSGLLAVAAK